MHGCRIHYTESRYNVNDFWHNFLGVSALVKPKYAMLSENMRHWPLTITNKFRLIRLEISVPFFSDRRLWLVEWSITTIQSIIDVYRQSALSLINEGNPE